MQTNIIENEINRFIEKLQDFGIDPVAFLSVHVEQLNAKQGAGAKPENESWHE